MTLGDVRPRTADGDDLDGLAARAGAGDAAAFEAIMRRHNRLMFRAARSVLRNDAESEEVVQEAYVKAWRGLSTFRGQARLSTWLVRIAMNEALSRLRRRSAVVVPFSAIDGPDGTPAELVHEERSHAGEDPEGLAMRSEMRQIVERHIDRLPEQFRTVFMLRAVEEMSVEEVAQALRIPEATVRTRFFRARALLREALAGEIDTATADAFSFDGARCDRIVASVLRIIDDMGAPSPGAGRS